MSLIGPDDPSSDRTMNEIGLLLVTAFLIIGSLAFIYAYELGFLDKFFN